MRSIGSSTGKVFTLSGNNTLSPVKFTQPNMDRFMRCAQAGSEVRGVSLAFVDPRARQVKLKVHERVTPDALDRYLDHLSNAIDPSGQQALRII